MMIFQSKMMILRQKMMIFLFKNAELCRQSTFWKLVQSLGIAQLLKAPGRLVNLTFAFKSMDSAFKTMNFVLQTMNFVLQVNLTVLAQAHGTLKRDSQVCISNDDFII